MIFNIIKKEVLHNIRDKKALFWMLMFPIIMIFILGNALSSLFGKDVTRVPKTKAVYTIQKKTDETKKVLDFLNESSQKLNMEFNENNDKENVLEHIKKGEYDCFLDIKDESNITIYSNDLKDFNAALVTNLLSIYVEKNNSLLSIKEKNIEGLRFVEPDAEPNFVEITSLNQKQRPNAIDYYSVTMLTMTILYSTLYGVVAVVGERNRKTMGRIACSPINSSLLFFGKLIGSVLVVCIQILLLYLVTKYLFGANWGTNKLAILGVVIAQILMAVSLGMGFARMIKNPNLVNVSVNIMIIIFNFLGGAYIPLDSFGPNSFINIIASISPLKWTNQSIFNTIYGNDTSLCFTSIFVNIMIAVVFTALPILFKKKGEV